MKKYDLHIHSVYSDGLNTIKEIVVSAIEKGFDMIGISDHSYTDFDLRYCMKDTVGYIDEILYLKRKYKDNSQYCRNKVIGNGH